MDSFSLKSSGSLYLLKYNQNATTVTDFFKHTGYDFRVRVAQESDPYQVNNSENLILLTIPSKCISSALCWKKNYTSRSLLIEDLTWKDFAIFFHFRCTQSCITLGLYNLYAFVSVSHLM